MKFIVPTRIETARLVLLKLRYEDAGEIFFTYASKAEATRFVSWPTHQSIEDTKSYLTNAARGWEQETDFSFGIRLRKDNRFIGSFGFVHNNGKLQFGYILSPTQWGQGYATEACRYMMKVARAMEGISRIWTFVDDENISSKKVLLKSGLVEEARLEKWFRFVNQGNEAKDCVIYRLP